MMRQRWCFIVCSVPFLRRSMLALRTPVNALKIRKCGKQCSSSLLCGVVKCRGKQRLYSLCLPHRSGILLAAHARRTRSRYTPFSIITYMSRYAQEKNTFAQKFCYARQRVCPSFVVKTKMPGYLDISWHLCSKQFRLFL